MSIFIKSKKDKKSGNVEVMPTINDGQKGMVTKPTNEAKNYPGPLYAPWSDVVKGRGFDSLKEKAEVYWSSKALDQLEEIQQREVLGERKIDPVGKEDADVDNDVV